MDTPISTFVKERRKMFNLTHADHHRRNLGTLHTETSGRRLSCFIAVVLHQATIQAVDNRQNAEGKKDAEVEVKFHIGNLAAYGNNS